MRPKRSYHHGNLRSVLLDAGVALIGEVGPQGFTIREVARRAGVSHNAPYRHFRDKDELLEAIAAEGFDRLTIAMRKRSLAGADSSHAFHAGRSAWLPRPGAPVHANSAQYDIIARESA